MHNFRPMGLFQPEPGSALPNRTGLFGRSLSTVSLSSIGGQEKAPFEFRASYYEDRTRFYREGELYNYRDDYDYNRFAKSFHNDNLRGRRDTNLAFLDHLKRYKLVLLPEFITDISFFYCGPLQAPEPDYREKTAFIWPSYIIWASDPSYISFFGVPDKLELPKDVLRATGGHPQSRPDQSPRLRPRASARWIV